MELFGHLFMMAYLGLVFLLSLYGLHRYWILYLYFRYYKWAPPLACPAMPNPIPKVTVQLPLYNERYVAERLIDAVCALDYPRERLEIQVLDDSTDMTREIVAQKIREMKGQNFNIVHVHRTQRTGYKAGALGEGLEKASGGIYCDL